MVVRHWGYSHRRVWAKFRVGWDGIHHSLPCSLSHVPLFLCCKPHGPHSPSPSSSFLEGNFSLVPKACCQILAIKCVLPSHVLHTDAHGWEWESSRLRPGGGFLEFRLVRHAYSPSPSFCLTSREDNPPLVFPGRVELIELIRKPPLRAIWLAYKITANEGDSQLAI